VKQHTQQECYQREYEPLAYQPYEHGARTIENSTEELRPESQSNTVHDNGHEQHQQPVSRSVEVD
jgi:hypothetical protein